MCLASPKATAMRCILFIISWFQDQRLQQLREHQQYCWENLEFTTFDEEDCILSFRKRCWTMSFICGSLCSYLLKRDAYLRQPISVEKHVAVGIWPTFLLQFCKLHVASTIRRVYTYTVVSERHLKSPLEVVCVTRLQSVSIMFWRAFILNLYDQEEHIKWPSVNRPKQPFSNLNGCVFTRFDVTGSRMLHVWTIL